MNVRHYVLDSSTLAPVPIGVPGELFISGPCVARGYLGRPDLTAAAFLQNPFQLPADGDSYSRMYRTGDIVMWLPSGIQRQVVAPPVLLPAVAHTTSLHRCAKGVTAPPAAVSQDVLGYS